MRKVVSETINGRTLTKVYDCNGSEIIKRAKSFRTYNVGNKKIREKQILKVLNKIDEVRYSDGRTDILLIGTKTKNQRVYNQDGKFLGGREISQKAQTIHMQNPFDRTLKWPKPLKLINNSEKTIKKFLAKKPDLRQITEMTIFKDGVRKTKTTAPYYQGSIEHIIYYNNKGLPIPPVYYLVGEAGKSPAGFIKYYLKKADGKTLKQMIDFAKHKIRKLKKSIAAGQNYGPSKLANRIFFEEQKLSIK